MKHKDFLKKIRLRYKQKVETCLVAERFPEVSSIIINMTYLRKQGTPVFMKRMIHLSPSSHAYFNMECMIKRGYDRGFDLTPDITRQIRQHKKLLKGELVFNNQKDNPASLLERILYEIRVRYKINE